MLLCGVVVCVMSLCVDGVMMGMMVFGGVVCVVVLGGVWFGGCVG